MNRSEALEELGKELEKARDTYLNSGRSIHVVWYESSIALAVGKYLDEYDKGWET